MTFSSLSVIYSLLGYTIHLLVFSQTFITFEYSKLDNHVRCSPVTTYRNSWTLDARVGRWTLDAGLWMLDSGRWTMDSGRWTLDVGLCLDSEPWTMNARH